MANGGWTPTRPLPPAPVPAPSPPQRDYDAEWRIQNRWIAELLNQNAALRAALRKLVDAKDMKDRLKSLHERGHGTDYSDYYRLKAEAWEAAREALRLENLEMK